MSTNEPALPFPAISPSRFARVLASVLVCANSSPPTCHREEFYRMKDAILSKHGKLIGTDLQHIVKPCWGEWEERGCVGDGCRRCGGTGVYAEKWIILERWELGARIFHRPMEATMIRPNGPVTIEGRLTHERWPGHQPTEAALWLALVFDRRLFCRMMFVPSSCACGWFLLPLVNLSRVFFRARMFAVRFRGQRCYCGRTFRRWFGRGGWCVCRRCRKPRGHVWTEQEIPF
jgi:hypothetical protein